MWDCAPFLHCLKSPAPTGRALHLVTPRTRANMTQTAPSIFETMNQINLSYDEFEAFTHFETHMARNGFPYCLIGLVQGPLSEPDTTPAFMVSNGPKSWRKKYSDNGWARSDPIIHMVRRSREPFYVTESYAKAGPEHMPVIAASVDLQMVEAFTFPMHHIQGDPGAVIFGSQTAFKLPKAEIGEYQLLARCIFDKIFSFYRPDLAAESIKLSDKQLAILTAVAEGKTNAEITDLTGLSPYKIRTLLATAGIQLQSDDRVRMASKAKKLGLIDPQ